jgi:hypothetical protein
MYLERHYQNAYVTPDLDRAVELLRAQYGVRDVMTIEATTDVRTPDGPGQATNKMAFAWVGKLQYELIEPVSGLVDFYRDAVSPDQLLRFHHIAMRVTGDWDAFRAELVRQKRPIPFEGQAMGGLQFLYVDARDTLGHYLEYVHATPEIWAQLDPNGATA